MTNLPADHLNALRLRLNNFGLANWVGRSTTTPNDMLRIAETCVEALDQFDRYEAEIGQLKLDLAQQALNGQTVMEQQREIARLQALLKKCAEPVSDQLAQARANLGLYNGYPSRERRYRVEVDDLEKLEKAIGAHDVGGGT